ncbi:MAG: nuclear transport factor 2 family protein [Paludibacterium sp.]|uniref:nuclear transport factor 2 family protein n=1 Tax=Paludibacterium sp. TaxID=1917523 RepID=UPI0025E7AE45|nr:nuclear transport factor 2 family protein [Paludibacterium sp.]MBV8046873.1 nuclear transport factor 2 family protein [Paludibacterium sp.]MBV8647149.1 nuclear transport factor 2 family protein [Paludibacterium sp.]
MITQAAALNLVRDFWRRMASNDFSTVAPLLSTGFVLEWPQSNERIRGAERFVSMNQDYPAHGPWRFTLNRLIGDEHEVVSDVSITDGVQHARAISFFTIEDSLIARLVEFWPEPYPAPGNRAHLSEPLDAGATHGP